MAKATVKANAGPEPVYDVAISFLVADEKTASAIDAQLGGLRVFYYPRNQEELIGTDGLESMRAPFLSSRVNVVLYRERYGKTPWTGVELSAIKDSCWKTSFRSLLFVQLEKTDATPEWLPDTHIRCVLGDFTIDQLVGAIKNKVQELGGVIHRPDAMSEAKRVKREAEYIADRDAMMQDRAWIEGTVHRSLHETFKKVGELVEQANKDQGFTIVCGANGYRGCIMRSGFVSLLCGWVQPIYTKVGDDPYGDCYLRVAEFSGPLLVPGERGLAVDTPRLLKEHRIKVGVSENRELVWLDGKEQIEPEADLILSNTTPTTAALLRQTRTIPIIFAMVADPVGSGFVLSFPRPGGNVTGFAVTEGSLGGKWLELLKEIAPRVTRVAMLFNPTAATYAEYWLNPFKAAAASFAVEAIAAPVRDRSELESVVAAQAREPNSGLTVMPDSFTDAHRVEITSLAARYRLPAVYAYRFFAALGGLLSYGVDLTDNFPRAATYADRILKGEKPADLPVQAPIKYVLTINLKTAKALGLDVPLHLQQRADEVIE